LVDEGYDLAIRIASEPSLHLVARELAPVSRVICATPDYFSRRGVPTLPRDLQQHNCLHYTHFGTQGEWRLRNHDGEITVPVKGSLQINDDDTLAQAVMDGLGIALLPTFIIGEELQAGRLQAVLAEYVPLDRRIYAVHLPNVRLPVKVRLFIDYLRERLGPQPYWDRIGTATPVKLSP
jgi:DNA-binding transcriptional LysR family regulator